MTEEVKNIIWGGISFKGDPEGCYRELQTLGENYSTEDIVEYARSNPESELYKCFDWDDETAAEKWRKHTARQICCSLEVVVRTTEKGERQTYRLIQNDREKKVYQPVTFTVRKEEEYDRLLTQAKRELAAFRQRYKSIVELSNVIDEIDRLIG